jgi:serine/threonine protein kinase/tetratricopeptide (TPR) repeat protein
VPARWASRVEGLRRPARDVILRLVHEGDVVAGRFLLLARHVGGGMGELFRARDLATGDTVALKTLRVGDPERFAREAATLAQLDHPAIVRHVASSAAPRSLDAPADGYDAREALAPPVPYLAMEWLDGEDLSVRLSRSRLSLGEALVLGGRISGALAAAHAIGVVHRDLKPANVFLPGGDVGAAKLLDFGIAWLAEAHFETEEGVVLGTVGYMAPEQARGLSTVSAAVDLFALGIVLFEALVGRPPFVGAHAVAVLGKLLVEPAPRLSELGVQVPAALEQLIDALLAKRPEERPRDAASVQRQLQAIAADAPARTPPARGLGVLERRLSSVILVSSAPSSRADTLSSSDWLRARNLQSVIAARHGASLELLRGGTSLVTLEGTGSLHAQATRAARCAIELHAAAGDDVVVLATGRRSIGGPVPVGEVIDRCAALLREAREAREASEASASAEPRAASAPPIRIDAPTASLLREDFVIGTDALGSFLGAPRTPRSAAPRPALFGRDRELALLAATFDECVAEQAARAVVLLGPPGIGKSRLAREALAQAAEGPGGAHLEVWEAAADPSCVAVPFSVLARAIGRAIGVRPHEPEANRARLRAWLTRCGATSTTAPSPELGLAILLGLPLPEGAEVPHTTRAALVRGAIETVIEATIAAARTRGAASPERPLTIYLDDVQWCDLPTLRLVDGLLRKLAGAPLLVLATARPELTDAHPRLFADRASTELRLGPLSRAAGERLVCARLGARIDGAALAALVERAQGHPLFLDELARAFEDGRGESTPSTVASVIELRLRALDPAHRRLLRAASVFGRRFEIDGVRSLLGPDAATEDLETPLDALVAHDVLVHEDLDAQHGPRDRRDPSAPPRFAFAHALFAEAAHAMLTEDDARLGHHLAAGWLAGRDADAMAIAPHFELAGEPERALALYERAAEEALEAGDATTAIVRVDRGLACGAEGERRGALEAIAADAHQHLGELEEAGRRGQAALALLGPRSPHWHRASRAAIALSVTRVRF